MQLCIFMSKVHIQCVHLDCPSVPILWRGTAEGKMKDGDGGAGDRQFFLMNRYI